MSRLFEPLSLRSVTCANRIWIAPMCQYSSLDGHPTDWHLVHLGGLARGGAGLVIQEATAVSPEGRISPWDAGIWTDAQAADYQRITDFIRSQGSVPGIQLAHAGRKASTQRPWDGHDWVAPADGGWQPVAPSAVAFGELPVPVEMSLSQIADSLQDWADAARRADEAGFDVVEIHAAHGYLVHQFLSPLSNTRTDSYGGDLHGRTSYLREVVAAVRSTWPSDKPVFVRLTGSDWTPGGLTVSDAEVIAAELAPLGVDLFDVSSGGISPDQQIDVGPGYQVPFARAVREAAGVPTSAVGLITDSGQAEKIVASGDADAVMVARQALRSPSWPQEVAAELGDDSLRWPEQYARARR